MCNDYEQHIAWAEYCRIMESLALQISSHQSELDLPQADIRINDPAPVMRAAGDAIELASMTFGFPPSGPN
ncbi:MAG: SOS response-associated peptidase, partial [Mesorhizobium sp.]